MAINLPEPKASSEEINVLASNCLFKVSNELVKPLNITLGSLGVTWFEVDRSLPLFLWEKSLPKYCLYDNNQRKSSTTNTTSSTLFTMPLYLRIFVYSLCHQSKPTYTKIATSKRIAIRKVSTVRPFVIYHYKL